mgnify:CR=1 FL=1|jgi:FkbM family methyltransferase|tara:strand:- start:49 stop:852 length:804 start_codon:yes stop_codon:yes gene_type:complete
MIEIIKLLKLLIRPKKLLFKLCEKYINFYNNFSYNFEKNGEKKLISLIRDQNFNIVFDVGCNEGDWSKIILNILNNVKIHTFEISQKNFFIINKNLKSDKITNNNFGLSNKNGEIFYKDYGSKYSTVNTIMTNTNFWDNTISPTLKKTNVITGDKYCKDNDIKFIDFLKIDTEGSESLVLEGFSNMLKLKQIRLIQFEYGYTNADLHFLMKDFYNFFENFGYIVGKIKPNGVLFNKFSYKLNDFKSGPNYLAIQKDDHEIKKIISIN